MEKHATLTKLFPANDNVIFQAYVSIFIVACDPNLSHILTQYGN